jgi:hypothetical protein
MVAHQEYFFFINDEKMELNSIRNVMETVVKSNLSDKIGFHNWVIAKSYSHVGRNKKRC